MTELEFKSLALQGFNRIPLIAEAFADLETPLSLYLKLAYADGPRDAGAAPAAAATASCSSRWSAASASAATRSSACRRERWCARPAFAARS